MRRIIAILPIIVLITLVLSGCVSSRKIHYFQGSDTLLTKAQQILQQYEMRIKPADQVLIKISCSNPELLEVFTQDVTMGTEYSGTSYTYGTLGYTYGYTVTDAGDLILPALGQVHVDGLSSEEAAQAIERRIQECNLIPDPQVTVRLLNARVAVVGAVKSPRVIELTSERNTIFDVLAQCNDVSDASLRQHVRLFREENGERSMYELDLTKADIFQSPGYYVQQNDMIYVEPNKSQSIRSSAFYTFLSAASSILALATTAASLYFLIK